MTTRKNSGPDLIVESRPITADMPFDAQKAALEQLIKQQPDTSRVLEITPELAEDILTSRNLSNRPMKSGKIKDYTADLKTGRWGLTGDTIKFAADGTLKDGQNRLAAAMRAKTPLVTHAVFGLDPDLFTRMDIGKNRTAADVFHIAGLHYANHAASCVRWLLILNGPNPANRGAHFTNEELLDAYRKQFDPVNIEASVKIALEVKKGTGAPVGPVAALHYICAEQDGTETANKFFLQWAHGNGGHRGPARVLQIKLQEMMLATNNRIHETVRNAMILQAYVAFRDGKTLTRKELDWDLGETFPTVGAAQEKKNEV